MRFPDPLAAAEEIVDNEVRKMADEAYNEVLAKWEATLAETEADFAVQLQQPDFVARVGLPADLPDFTVNILKRTMALDKVGPRKPRRDLIYRRFGLTAP